ncbi:GtrA family protein [Candidatus Woesearchaeota archaeon]|jgi:putative flippase GtrA|nr:GtrA family protein [Candidatus Woesearchaeota archaeon]MBT7062751.1 GtrA family protein [Candidatus Woesearchaeota archaeon]MBT7402673.1 GtrA family protein [Candidatus Woesearchaeota archaeon]
MNLGSIKEFLKNSKSAQMIRFGAVAGFSSIFELLAFYLILFTDVHYQIAVVISFTFGSTLRYIFSRKFAFKSQAKSVKTQFTAFLSISVFDLLINMVFMYVFVELVMFGPMLSRILAGAVAFVIVYILHKKISFNSNLIK